MSVTVTSDSVTVDTDGPTAGSVTDSSSTDLDWTKSTSTLTGVWSGFSDALSGINKYEYAIGSNAGGTNVVASTDNTTATSVTKTGLTLANGITYFISVRATDSVGNISTTATSDGITVDTDVPVISSVLEGAASGDDVDYQNYSDSLTISWTGSDAASGISVYEYALGTTSGGDETINWASAGTATSDTLTGLNLTEGSTYYLSARGTDIAGNISDVLSGDGITIDLTAPTGTTVNDGISDDITYTSSDSTLSANWAAFTDAASGVSKYEVSIGTTIEGTSILDWTDNGIETTYTKTGLTLSSGTIYFVNVRATDLAGNISEPISTNGVTVDTQAPDNIFIFDGLSTEELDWTCLLYTSPSPRD